MIEVYCSPENRIKVLKQLTKMAKDLNVPCKIVKKQKKTQEEKYYLSIHNINLKGGRRNVEYYMFSGSVGLNVRAKQKLRNIVEGWKI